VFARAPFPGGAATAFAAVLACALGGPVHAQERGASAFVGVSVVRVDNGDVLPDYTVLVEDGKIREVGPSAAVYLPPDVTRIPGAGRFLVPGLIHTRGWIPAAGAARPEDVLLLYLARGVTTLRAPGTHEAHEELREDVEDGDLPGPRLVLVDLGAPGSQNTREDASRRAPGAAEARGGDALIELLLPGAEVPASMDVAPLSVLRSGTLEAAAELGAEDAGVVRVGARADLILLEGNPLETLASLRDPAGVMTDGRWRTRAQLEREVERRARDLVLAYGRIPSRTDLRGSCTGTTLHECFGGEQRCTGSSVCSRAHLGRERGVLMTRLELLGAIFPANDWILGQRVNSAVEHADTLRALAVSEACAGTLWWCQMLRGYALHQRGEAALAELRFDSAIANTPEGQLAWVRPGDPGFDDRMLRCEWRDLRYLVGGRLLEDYQSEPCGQNDDFEARFWWLADPLWSVPGNPRRSEHFSRIVVMRLHDDQGRDRGAHVQTHHWQVMPVGVPNSWRTVVRQVRGQDESRREAFVDGGYSFVPDERRFADPSASTAREWEVALGEGEERMVTREAWHNLDHQDVLLRRGDHLLFLAAARPPRLLESYDSVRATLAMGHPADLTVELTPATIDEVGVVRARTELDAPGSVASLEVSGDGWVGRARHGLRPPVLADGFGVSEPVLVDERLEGGLPLPDALLPSTQLGSRTRVGVYFEVYGVSRDEPLRVGVSAERTNRSLLRRLTGALRLTTDATLDVNWQEAADTPAANLMTRYLAVDLGGLDDGDYRLTLRVERASGVAATSARVISLER
jgi:hypothetical protein